MSVWTSNDAIMRDLSKAQGCVVPVDMNSTAVAVSANQKPPQVVTEETEEEIYNNFVCGDVDYGSASAAPDLGLIQKMLDMVKCDNSSDTSIDDDLIQISKQNHTLPLPTKQNEATSKQCHNKLKPSQINVNPTEVGTNFSAGDNTQKKKQRNAAVISLLAALDNKDNEPLKLLKPTDFMTTKTVEDSVRKVDEWFTNKENSSPKQTKNVPSLTSLPMFKKKSVSEKCVKQTHRCVKPVTSPSQSTGTFKPSSKADEYYQKYMEKSQLNNQLKEDIWRKAERLMKEADAKRAAESAQRLDETDSIIEHMIQQSLHGAGVEELTNVTDLTDLPTESETTAKLTLVALPKKRHTHIDGHENEECIVCAMVKKHGFSIQSEDSAEV